MTIGKLVKDTRSKMGVGVREFATLCDCSRALVNFWELGHTPPRYKDMYYLYTHSPRPELRDMAAGIMQALNPGRAAGDIDDTSNGEPTNNNASATQSVPAIHPE